MGIADKMSQMGQNVQEGVRVTAIGTIAWSLKIFSGLVLGLTGSLIGVEAFHYGNIAFFMILIFIAAIVVRLLRKMTILNVLVFDLICVLVGLSLKMYIMLAP